MLTVPKAIAYILIASSILYFTAPNQEDKNVTITLPVSEWKEIIRSVQWSEAISSKEGNAIINSIQSQVTKQFADTTQTKAQKAK